MLRYDNILAYTFKIILNSIYEVTRVNAAVDYLNMASYFGQEQKANQLLSHCLCCLCWPEKNTNISIENITATSTL